MTDQYPWPENSILELKHSNFAELFRRAEDAIKVVEHRHGDLTIPAVNELRYAGYHIALYVQDSSKNDEIQKACGHCKRAIYDAYEAGILYCCKEYNAFQEDYKNCVITAVMPGYIEKKTLIRNSLDFIRSIDKETRDKDYERCRQYHEELIDIVDSLNSAREDLNKIIKKERKNTQFIIAGLLATIFSVVVAVIIALSQHYDNKPCPPSTPLPVKTEFKNSKPSPTLK